MNRPLLGTASSTRELDRDTDLETHMPQTITMGPVTRIEGHLDIEVTVEAVAGVQTVVDARCAGTTFRV